MDTHVIVLHVADIIADIMRINDVRTALEILAVGVISAP